jgi:hypothetical protein
VLAAESIVSTSSSVKVYGRYARGSDVAGHTVEVSLKYNTAALMLAQASFLCGVLQSAAPAPGEPATSEPGSLITLPGLARQLLPQRGTVHTHRRPSLSDRCALLRRRCWMGR